MQISGIRISVGSKGEAWTPLDMNGKAIITYWIRGGHDGQHFNPDPIVFTAPVPWFNRGFHEACVLHIHSRRAMRWRKIRRLR